MQCWLWKTFTRILLFYYQIYKFGLRSMHLFENDNATTEAVYRNYAAALDSIKRKRSHTCTKRSRSLNIQLSRMFHWFFTRSQYILPLSSYNKHLPLHTLSILDFILWSSNLKLLHNVKGDFYHFFEISHVVAIRFRDTLFALLH